VISVVLGAILVAPPTIKVMETPMPGQPVVISTLIRMPELRGNDFSVASALVESLNRGTQGFTERQMLAFGSQAGVPPTVRLANGGILIQVTSPVGALSNAAMLTESYLREPQLNEEYLKELIPSVPSIQRSRYEWALMPFLPKVSAIKPSDVQALWARSAQKENISISIAGEFPSGAGIQEMNQRLQDWRPERGRAGYVSGSPEFLTSQPTEVGSICLSGKPAKTLSDLATATVSMTLLGVGKSSSLFRVWRSEQGMSYQQDAFVMATTTGFAPKLVVLQRDRPSTELVQSLRDSLIKDIAHWSAEDVLNAAQVVRHGMMGRFPIPPMWFSNTGPSLGGSTIGSAWGAYQSALGTDFTLAQLFSACAQVKLPDAQAYAKDFLEQGSVTLLNPSN